MFNKLSIKLVLMFEKVIKNLGIFNHEFESIGTGVVFSQKSSFYKCKKCKATAYVPLGMEDMLIAGGCTRK